MRKLIYILCLIATTVSAAPKHLKGIGIAIEAEEWTNNYAAISEVCLDVYGEDTGYHVWRSTNHADRLNQVMEGWRPSATWPGFKEWRPMLTQDLLWKRATPEKIGEWAFILKAIKPKDRKIIKDE